MAEERLGRSLEFDDLSGEFVDPTRQRRVPALEELVFDLVDVILEPGDYRGVLVNDLIDDRVEHRLRAETEQLRGALEPLAYLAEVWRLRVADGDDEVLSCKDVKFPELDLFGCIEVPCGPKDGEERRSVALELRTLMGCDGVLYGQLVQLEFMSHGPDLFEIGSVQSDPGHAAPFAQGLVGLIECAWIGGSPSTDVHRVVDQTMPTSESWGANSR